LAFRRHRAGDKVGGRRGRGGKDRAGAVENESAASRELSPEKARQKIFARALKILAARPRSEEQLRERLLDKPWAEPEIVERCIERLKELGYINDQAFAQNYASHRVTMKPVGRARVARELATKRVPRQLIDTALETVFEEVSEEELIDRAIAKRMRTHGKMVDRAGEKRMFDYLVRQGFEYDLIIRRLRALKTGPSDED
jgi:regulatory protein